MKYYFAPMEGITTHVFRAVHSRRFPGADRYYTPFFSPTSDHLFTPRELRELTPETPCAAPVVPQILSKCAADIVWAAEGLQDMGYMVFNLNLGCPSATVTAKGKGAGLLQKPDALDTLLADVFAASPIAVSLKSRIGYLAPEEFPRLLSIYRQYNAQAKGNVFRRGAYGRLRARRGGKPVPGRIQRRSLHCGGHPRV